MHADVRYGTSVTAVRRADQVAPTTWAWIASASSLMARVSSVFSSMSFVGLAVHL